MNSPDRKPVTRKQADQLTDDDFAQDKMGRNSLHGNDQVNVRNERKD